METLFLYVPFRFKKVILTITILSVSFHLISCPLQNCPSRILFTKLQTRCQTIAWWWRFIFTDEITAHFNHFTQYGNFSYFYSYLFWQNLKFDVGHEWGQQKLCKIWDNEGRGGNMTWTRFCDIMCSLWGRLWTADMTIVTHPRQ